MNQEIEKLRDLQEVEAEISRLTTEIAALPRRVQAIEAKLASANERVAQAHAAIKADEVARRKFESDIKTQNERISKFREQSLGVKTNEQYRALMNEISFAEQEIRSLEDKILEKMVAADTRQQDIQAAQRELAEQGKEIEREKAAARARTAEAQKLLTGYRERQKGLRAEVESSLLMHFDRLMRSRGSALAEAIDQRCTACQVLLRPQVFNDIRLGGKTVTCDSCSRILYYDPAHAPEELLPAELKSPAIQHAWFYVERGSGGEFLVMWNSKSGCSMHAYDAQSGRALGRHSEKGKSYEEAFSAMLHDARNLFVDDPKLADCKEQLPEEALFELRRQLPRKSGE